MAVGALLGAVVSKLEVYRRQDAALHLASTLHADDTLTSPLLPGFACPVTESFWADGASAAWKARPAYDCDLASAAGERDARTGVWKFDLTAVAALWTAEGYKGSTSVAPMKLNSRLGKLLATIEQVPV